jgi:hypothetical protein
MGSGNVIAEARERRGVVKLAISQDALKDLYNDLTEKVLEAGRNEEKDRKEHKLQYEWWGGYAEALVWVRDELLELEKPEASV